MKEHKQYIMDLYIDKQNASRRQPVAGKRIELN